VVYNQATDCFSRLVFSIMMLPFLRLVFAFLRVSCFACLLFGISLYAEDADSAPSNWNNSYNVRSWFGYKDNVLLGEHANVDSVFVAGGLDALFWRMPVNGWEYLIFGTGDYIRYLPGKEVDKEVTAIAQDQPLTQPSRRTKRPEIIEAICGVRT
jgi:hypothetical protein